MFKLGPDVSLNGSPTVSPVTVALCTSLPTPMTVATETWYTGYHPYTLQPVFSAKTPKEKLAQRMFFFWYKPEERRAIINELRKIGRADLIDKLYGKDRKSVV